MRWGNGWRMVENMETVYFEVTTACPCSCNFCHIPLNLRHENPLTRNFEDLIVDFSILKEKLNVENLIISGGEPTLRSDILSLTEFASKLFRKVAVISNCTNPETLKQVSEYATVWVSLDYYGEAQDKSRGFKGLWRNYLNIADIANIRATLLHDNLKDVEKLIAHANQHDRKTTIVPCKTTNPKFTPSPLQLQQLLLYIFKNGYAEKTVVDDPTVRMWLATKNPELMKKAQENGICTACDTVIRVDPQGTVKPCPFLNWKICHVTDPEIKQKIAQTRQKILKTHTGKCVNCKYKEICGGCRASENLHCFLS